jgi:hypothetical protein
MNRLIAEDLVLLCWDDEQGKPQQPGQAQAPAGYGYPQPGHPGAVR